MAAMIVRIRASGTARAWPPRPRSRGRTARCRPPQPAGAGGAAGEWGGRYPCGPSPGSCPAGVRRKWPRRGKKRKKGATGGSGSGNIRRRVAESIAGEIRSPVRTIRESISLLEDAKGQAARVR